MATYEFKPDQEEVDDTSKIVLKTIMQPEQEVVKEVTVAKLEAFLADMTEQRDKLQVDIDAVTAEIGKIKTDLNIKEPVKEKVKSDEG